MCSFCITSSCAVLEIFVNLNRVTHCNSSQHIWVFLRFVFETQTCQCFRVCFFPSRPTSSESVSISRNGCGPLKMDVRTRASIRILFHVESLVNPFYGQGHLFSKDSLKWRIFLLQNGIRTSIFWTPKPHLSPTWFCFVLPFKKFELKASL